MRPSYFSMNYIFEEDHSADNKFEVGQDEISDDESADAKANGIRLSGANQLESGAKTAC